MLQAVQRETFYVKALGLPRIAPSSLFNEAFGNLLAREFKIPTPQPALINLSPSFAEIANEQLANRGCDYCIQPGIACGCVEFSAGYTSVSPIIRWGPESLDVISRIYGFDMMVQNPDRRLMKPNCAFSGKKIMAFDFEQSFSFASLLDMPGESARSKAWEFSQYNFCRDHIFWRELRSQTVNWEPFIAEVKTLSEKRLQGLITRIPEEWCDSAGKVVEHLMEIAANSKHFHHEILRSLSCAQTK
jgi:hypothetical protein